MLANKNTIFSTFQTAGEGDINKPTVQKKSLLLGMVYLNEIVSRIAYYIGFITYQ